MGAKRTSKVAVAATVIAAGAMTHVPAIAADDTTTVAVDIDSQPIEAALVELSKQGHLQLVISSGSLPAKVAGPLHGSMTLGVALGQLLKDTGLTYKFVGDHTIAIVPPAGHTSQLSDPPTSPGSSGDPGSTLASADESVDAKERADSSTKGDHSVKKSGFLSRIATFLGICASTVGHGTACAQDSGDQAAASAPAQEREALQEVIVTGIRASIQSAREIKQNSDTIVDSIVAEDIGKFPDNNVVESLARIPGIQITRREGEGNGIKIRGLDQAKTLLNGRELFGGNSGGDYSSRDFNLGDLPSDALAGIDVYKASTADQLEGGLGGYIDVRTRRAFDFSGPIASISAKETYYDRVRGLHGEWKPSYSVLLSDRWQTGVGEFGALINYSHGKTALSQDRQQVAAEAVRNDYAGSGQTVHLPGATFLNGTQWGTHERETVLGSLQWKPNDSLELYFDGYYVDYKRVLQFADFRITTGTATSNYTLFPGTQDLRSGEFTNTNIDSATAYADEFRKLHQYAIGGTWNNGGKLTVKGDVSYTTTDNLANLYEWDMKTTIPDSVLSRDAKGNINYNVMGYGIGNPANYKPAYLLSILLGGEQSDTAAKFDGRYEFGDGWIKSLDSGVRFSRYVATNPSGNYVNFYCINDFGFIPTGCGGGALTSANIPSSFINTYPSVAGNFVGWNVSAERQQADLRNYFGAPVSEAPQNSQYLHNVERALAYYAKLNFSVPLHGALVFDGNVGSRLIHTRQSSQAFGTDPGNPSGPQTLLTTDGDRTDVLPSFNGRLKFNDDNMLRISAGKSIERIPFAKLNGAIIVTNQAQHEARRGNPDLSPYSSWNYDLSLEHYFARTGLLYLAGFYKDVKGFLQGITLYNQTIPGYTGNDWRVATYYNASKSIIKGYEAGGQTFFDFLPAPFDGFGIQANYTFINSQQADPNGNGTVPVTGLPRSSYNLIGLYDKGPVNARLAYTWIDRTIGTYNVGAGPDYTDSYGVLDASVGYEIIKDKLALTLDAANILGYNERLFRQGRTTDAAQNLQTDKRYGIQLSYKTW